MGVTAAGDKPQSLLCLALREIRKKQGSGCHLWHYLVSSSFMTDLSVKHRDCRFSLFPKLCNLVYFTPKLDFFSMWSIAIGNDHQASKCRKKCFSEFLRGSVSVCFPQEKSISKTCQPQSHSATLPQDGQGD